MCDGMNTKINEIDTTTKRMDVCVHDTKKKLYLFKAYLIKYLFDKRSVLCLNEFSFELVGEQAARAD